MMYQQPRKRPGLGRAILLVVSLGLLTWLLFGSLAVLLASQSSGATAPSTSAATRYGWGKPIARDEFTGTAPLTPRWSVYNGPGHHNEGRRSPAAWHQTGYSVYVHGDAKGTTGGMSADWAGSDRKYQRVEVRMRTTARDPRYHPVLILWPQDGYLRAKCDGEVDFSESTKNTTLTHFYLHYSCANTQTTTAYKNDTTKWHNYAVEWTASGIKGFIDGRQVFSDTNKAHLPPQPMHPTIQLDYFPKDGSGPLKPTDMAVDWIRVYR